MTRSLGSASITMFNGGDFRLDGGAMHGVVPKTIWSKLVSCDEHNRCTYTTNCALVETGGKRVLIESGNGDKFPPKLKDIYGIDHDHSAARALRELGVEPESIDVVVLTHLHFDHVGGCTTETPSGIVPVFPRARHVVQAKELAAARAPHERNRASYLPENIDPLEAAGLLQVVDGQAEVAPGITVLPSPGHSRGHQSVLIDGGDQKALFLGDVVPTQVHVPLPWIMGYDLDVEGTLASRKHLYARALEENWLLLFGHDRHLGAYLERDARGHFKAGPPVDL